MCEVSESCVRAFCTCHIFMYANTRCMPESFDSLDTRTSLIRTYESICTPVLASVRNRSVKSHKSHSLCVHGSPWQCNQVRHLDKIKILPSYNVTLLYPLAHHIYCHIMNEHTNCHVIT